MIHRMQAVNDCIYLEASTPEITDVVRLSDDYDRSDLVEIPNKIFSIDLLRRF